MDALTDTGSTPVARSASTSGPDASKPRVVVGIDGSPQSRTALVHALIAAARRGAGLDIVASYAIELYWLGGAPLDVPDIAAVRDDTEGRARALVDDVQQEVPLSAVPGIQDVSMTLVVLQGPAAHVLVEHARNADLLVVGSRGRGSMRSALLGSVALHCVTHASCPVVVVHADAVGVSEPPKVVVGVDFSAGARAALGEAIREATLRGADLDVVVSYEITHYWTDMSTVAVPSVDQIHVELRRRTEDLVREVVAEREVGAAALPQIRTVVAQGPAGEALVHHARIADLLVVGSRGHGAFRGLLLGSVALHCAMHAPGPVMVVHPQQARVPGTRSRPEPAMADR